MKSNGAPVPESSVRRSSKAETNVSSRRTWRTLLLPQYLGVHNDLLYSSHNPVHMEEIAGRVHC